MKKGAFVGILLALWQPPALAMNLQEYLKAVESNHRLIKSFSVSTEAAQERRLSADLELNPRLTAGLGYLSDKSPLGQFAMLGATETTAKDLKLGLAKKFSTGTSVSVDAAANEVENEGTLFVPSLQKFSYGSLGVGISQSLWKDSFGRATRLRWERQDAATEAEVGSFDLNRKQLLIEAEKAYWDYIYLDEYLKIGRASLERAKRIEAWTRRRVNDGISERADLLSTQALVGARQLAVISAEDDFAAAKRKIRDFLELSDSENLPEITGDISSSRSLNSMVNAKGGKVMALDAYLAALTAKARALESREIEDNFRPDIVLSGSYNTNNLQQDKTISEATAKWTDSSLPTWKVGLNLTYDFDTDVKNSAQSAARKNALAAKLQSERKMLDSESAWIELNRRYSEMSKRIETASEIAKLQVAAAKAQADLFNKGRSITANVIKAEEDAAEAELMLTRLKSEQRKMEAQGRMFVVIEEN
ncbi:TolC family protein [Bdellovibrio reynosensis]|uniref:TolC family protein n=1 Tax=Bdellovibrio reynosensis TaxID=2835041 RepID=A0ABY4CB50_9BACT|nr:TolC family protein [Bdellovibrio reynosensis]UOF02165.1 TolC family protein [Bdellovibrio reynosensis]